MMSTDSQMEEGIARQVPGPAGEISKPTCLGLFFSSIGKYFYLVMDLIGKTFYWILFVLFMVVIILIYEPIKFLIKLGMRYVIKRVVKVAINKKIFLLISVIAILVDPLFYYIPVMNDDEKCIEMDKDLGITVTVLRSVFDSLKIIHFIFELDTGLRAQRIRKRLWFFFLIDIFASLPIPQVLVNLRSIRGTNLLYSMSLSLIQYLLRVIRTYHLFIEATGVSGILAEASSAIVGFNILLYMLGGHVFGALWYFYAIANVAACWKKTCINHSGCDHSSFYCAHSSVKDYRFLNDFCGINTGNTTDYDFGLFSDALTSGIVEVKDFPKKLLHCLQWGLQNLSAFGQNLQTSTDIWENIFAICMTCFGVVLFVFLIGQMQTDTARSQKIRQKWKEIKQWPKFGEISSDVRGQLRKYKREKWQETKRVDVDNLVSDLPEGLGNKIKHNVCIELLKNVNEFENWSEKSLGYLCEFLKPVFFIKRTRIIREGDPIDEMLFVLKGKLCTYPSRRNQTATTRNRVLKGKLWTYTSKRNQTATTSNNRRAGEHRLEDGDVFGEELISWAKKDRSADLPISTKTIQALTDVEAFSLMADDLKHVFSLSHFDQAIIFLQSYWRFRKFMRERRKKKLLFKKVIDWAARELH